MFVFVTDMLLVNILCFSKEKSYCINISVSLLKVMRKISWGERRFGCGCGPFKHNYGRPYTKGEEVSDQNRMVVVWRRGYQNLRLWQVINEWPPIAEIIFGFYLWVLLLFQFLVFLNSLGLLKFNLKLIWNNNLKIEIWLEGLNKDLFQVTLLFREKKALRLGFGLWWEVGSWTYRDLILFSSFFKWKCYNLKDCNKLLTHFRSMFLSTPTENVRKSNVFVCFKVYRKQTFA